MSSPKLSILIPTIPERLDQYAKLYSELVYQSHKCFVAHPTLGKVEIKVLDSPKYIDGGMSVGAKRNQLVQECDGEYCCFIDDDETCAPNYVEQLLRLCYTGKDICTFRSIMKCDTYWSVIDLSLKHKDNEQATPERIVKRRPFHICPVKTSIAKQFHFPDINNAEDWQWMEQVLTKVKTEAKTLQILHQYNHSKLTSAVDAIEA